jgi:hypothetical protein
LFENALQSAARFLTLFEIVLQPAARFRTLFEKALQPAARFRTLFEAKNPVKMADKPLFGTLLHPIAPVFLLLVNLKI